MSTSHNYTACVVSSRSELENAVENKKHVIICRDDIFNDLKESGFIDKIESYRKSKKLTTVLGAAAGVSAVILSSPLGWLSIGIAALSGKSAHSKGKKDDLKNFKDYKTISYDMLKKEIVFFHKDYDLKHDTYHEYSI